MIRTKDISLTKYSEVPVTWAFEYLLGIPGRLRGQQEMIRSPFSRDSQSSFSLYVPKGKQEYRFKCFSTGIGGTPADLMIELKRLKGEKISLKEAGKLLVEAFEKADVSFNNEPFLENTAGTITKLEMMSWTKEQLGWWKQYNVTKENLEFHNAAAIKFFHMHKVVNGVEKNMVFENNPLTFGYFDRTGDPYKIYRPGTKMKFIKIKKYVQGYDQLTNAKNLLITKSLKDVMAFKSLEIDGWNAISPDSENVMLPTTIFEEMASRHKKILVLFDNDIAGKKAAGKYKEQFNLNNIQPELSKDISDSIFDFGESVVKLKLLQLL